MGRGGWIPHLPQPEHLVGDRLDISYDKLNILSNEERAEVFLEKFKQYKLAPESISASDFEGFLEQMLHHNDISMHHIPSHYSGEVIIIRAENPLILDDDDTTYGTDRPEDLLWGKFSENISIVTSPGNHASIMRSPNVEVMTKRLQNVLRL